jgi:hypothetical protein
MARLMPPALRGSAPKPGAVAHQTSGAMLPTRSSELHRVQHQGDTARRALEKPRPDRAEPPPVRKLLTERAVALMLPPLADWGLPPRRPSMPVPESRAYRTRPTRTPNAGMGFTKKKPRPDRGRTATGPAAVPSGWHHLSIDRRLNRRRLAIVASCCGTRSPEPRSAVRVGDLGSHLPRPQKHATPNNGPRQPSPVGFGEPQAAAPFRAAVLLCPRTGLGRIRGKEPRSVPIFRARLPRSPIALTKSAKKSAAPSEPKRADDASPRQPVEPGLTAQDSGLGCRSFAETTWHGPRHHFCAAGEREFTIALDGTGSPPYTTGDAGALRSARRVTIFVTGPGPCL